MGNASVHSHNSVPVADSSEARDVTPLYRFRFYIDDFLISSTLLFLLIHFSSISRNLVTIPIWRNVGKLLHKYVSTRQEKFIKFFMT